MRPLTLLAQLACALTTTSCATRLPASPAAPRLEMPTEARQPCELHRLPPAPTFDVSELSALVMGGRRCEAPRGSGPVVGVFGKGTATVGRADVGASSRR